MPLLIFVISYPVTLFICSKMLLPTNDLEEKTNMKKFYYSQFQIIFIFVSLSIVLSVLFNIFILNRPFYEQTILLLFLTATLFLSIKNNDKEILHKLLAIFILLVSITVLVFENNFWVVK